MAFGTQNDTDEVMNEINMTPLVDVMLVLLIIFLITIPVVTTSIKVDLPKEKNLVRETKPETVIISVDVKGKIFLYDTPIKNSDDLLQRMKKFSVMKPQPEVQIRGDGKSDFESVGRVMYAVQRAIDEATAHLQSGLAVLASVGSTAPFVGLFGTVWGIYHALVQIGAAGQASIDQVAGPIGEALIMTALGLAVAIPAVLGYNWLVRRNKAIMEDVNAFGSDLHSVLLASSNK